MLNNDCSKILSPQRAGMRACGGPLDRLDHCIKEKLSLTPSPSLSFLLARSLGCHGGEKSAEKSREWHAHTSVSSSDSNGTTHQRRTTQCFISPISRECVCCSCTNCVGVGVFSHCLLERILRNKEGSLTTPPISIQPWYTQPAYVPSNIPGLSMSTNPN